MVDWQFTVFCRKVRFVVIYAFLVLIFCGNICVCAIYITFCNSAAHMTLLYQQHEKTPPPLERGSYLKAGIWSHCPINIYHFCQKHLLGGKRV